MRLPTADECVTDAQRRAHGNWGAFVEAIASKLGSNYAVKVPIVDGAETEHMWLAPTLLGPEEVTGILTGKPQDVGNVREGDVLHVPLSNVEDWVYWRPDGSQVGFYSAICFAAPESTP